MHNWARTQTREPPLPLAAYIYFTPPQATHSLLTCSLLLSHHSPYSLWGWNTLFPTCAGPVSCLCTWWAWTRTGANRKCDCVLHRHVEEEPWLQTWSPRTKTRISASHCNGSYLGLALMMPIVYGKIGNEFVTWGLKQTQYTLYITDWSVNSSRLLAIIINGQKNTIPSI